MEHTLVDDEISDFAQRFGLITPYRGEPRLKGASYDVSVGETLIVLTKDGPKGHSLRVDLRFRLEPGQSCIVSSLEKLKFPETMKGRISLRAHLQLRGLAFPGGAIDPGFFGLLYFPVTNISGAALDIEFDEPFATVEFTLLEKQAHILYNGGREIVSPPETFLKPKNIVPYTLVELRSKIDGLATSFEGLRSSLKQMEPQIGVTQRILELFLLAAVGSIAAAAFFH
jgi:deoxycytidine triphosphate deaminase